MNVRTDLRRWTVSALFVLPLLMAMAGGPRDAVRPAGLSDARFLGLTRIVVSTDRPMTGITAREIVITKPDGAVIPAEEIAGVKVSDKTLTVLLKSAPFARITSEGTTIAVRAFGSTSASPAVKVVRSGEPAAHGRIIGTSASLDEGWNTLRTDPSYVDPISGEKGLYHFSDLTPDRDENDRPLAWNDGRVLSPAHRSKTMLMLLVEFPDRKAADAGAPYTDAAAYLDFLKDGMTEWFALSSYGQFRFSLVSPQVEKKLGWILMGKNAADYNWNGSTAVMFAYIREACQRAYDAWGIKADDYDLLVVMPARGTAGLPNGPANINHDPEDGRKPAVNHVAYVDRDGRPHYIDTAITAGNDLFRWGYRWAIHESGHTFGLPDLYSYFPVINGVKIGSFFFCGGWDMMGHIAGHSTDFLAWAKWKLRWIRDDQVDVVSQASRRPTTHILSPVETPGGTKMAVVRTGLSTAYVAEFRTRLGVNALEDRAKYSGVLLYRIDATRSGSRGAEYTAQIISKKFVNDPAVGGPKNLTGFWRPIDDRTDGYNSPDCCWQPGDCFSDPATGVTIRVDGITHGDAADPRYTADDVATVTVEKSRNAELFRNVVLSNARLKDSTVLTFETNIEMQWRPIIPLREGAKAGRYVREDSRLAPESLVITRSDGTVVPEDRILKVVVSPTSVEVKLAEGAFPRAGRAEKATVATKAYYHFGPGAAVPIRFVD